MARLFCFHVYEINVIRIDFVFRSDRGIGEKTVNVTRVND